MNSCLAEVSGAGGCHTGWRSQFARPRGVLGWLAGHLLAVKNRQRGEWVRSLLDVQPGDHVLEIGFGPGVDILRVSEVVEHGFVAGIDPSAEMVRQAGKRNALMMEAGIVELLCASAERIPYPADSFDKVFAINSLQFCGDLPRVLHEIRRVLKPGGVLTVAVQPRLAGATERTVDQVEAALRNSLRDENFRWLRRERKLMAPVSCVCVQAAKPGEQHERWESNGGAAVEQRLGPRSGQISLRLRAAEKF